MAEENKALKIVSRAADDGKLSKQPRFKSDSDSTINAIIRWVKTSDIDAPPYSADSRTRDQWLSSFWMVEPMWAGIISQTVLIDSSRAWSMIGGRNQVNRYTAMMHNADGGRGWREFFRKQSLSYRTTDMGALTELGRDGEDGPLRAIYHVDPTCCRHMPNMEYPLRYFPSGRAKMQQWGPGDYFNITSLPSIREKFNSLGYCATSRALELAKIMYGVLMHDQEQLGAKMPRGVLIFDNISETQWTEALETRRANLEQFGREYFDGVVTLVSEGAEQVNVRLVALSQLPANFDRVDFISQTMYGYALVANYDAREFYPVSGGTLGTGTETETQHAKAATKGALEFPHAWQERFQTELPDSLHFEFEERDAEGLLLDAQVAQAWAEVAQTLYQTDPVTMMGLLPREQVLSLLVDKGIIPPEYTEFEEDAQSTDTEEARVRRLRERAMTLPQVRAAIMRYPDEPVVRYTYGPAGASETLLWPSGWHTRRPTTWRGVDVKRQEEGEVLFSDEEMDFTITEGDVERAVATWNKRMPEELTGVLTAEPIE